MGGEVDPDDVFAIWRSVGEHRDEARKRGGFFVGFAAAGVGAIGGGL